MRSAWGCCVVLALGGLTASAAEPYQTIYPKQDRAVGAALSEPTRAAYSGSLRDVIGELAREHHIGIIIDEQALTEAGIDLDDDIDFDAANFLEQWNRRAGEETREIDLAMLLRIFLDPYDATYVVEDGVLKVTTEEAVVDRTFLRAYEVAPLLGGETTTEEFGKGVARLAASLKTGRRNVSRDPSMSSIHVNAAMTVVPYKSTLIVTATSDDHERVENALQMMGQVAGE